MNEANLLTRLKGLVMGDTALTGGFLKRATNVSIATLKAAANLTATATGVTTTALNDGSADNTMIGALDLTDYTPHSSGGTTVTSNAATDLDTTAAALETFRDEQAGFNDSIEKNFDKLGDEVNALVADVAAIKQAIGLTADETNAIVYKVEEANDTVGTWIWTVPRDYDEALDVLKVRVLASQLTQSTDDDVELDAQVYVKTAGSALGSDLNPTAPGTVLSTTEQWIEFDLDSNSLVRDNVVYFKLITNGGNDTDGEEVLIHDVEFIYRSTIVSYDRETSTGTDLR